MFGGTGGEFYITDLSGIGWSGTGFPDTCDAPVSCGDSVRDDGVCVV